MTISSLRHASIIMLSAIWLEFSNLRVTLSRVTKCHSEHQPLFIHMHDGRPQDYSQMCYDVPIQTVCSIFIWGTLAHLLTVKLEEHLASSWCLRCSSLSQKSFCLQFPWLYVLSQCVSNCFTNKHPGSYPTFNMHVIETANNIMMDTWLHAPT